MNAGADPVEPDRDDVGIAVNLLWCDPGRVGGSEEYLVRQLLGLVESQRAPELRPTIYCLEAFAAAHPELVGRTPTRPLGLAGTPRWRRVLAEHSWLARETRGADLVHHGGGTVPAVGTTPVLLTVHDVQYLTYPDYVAPIKLRYLRRAVPRSIRRAAAVAVPSEYVRSTIIDTFDVDPERVLVVPHGVDVDRGVAARSEDELRARYGLAGHRLLVYPAITHPHKGHLFLLDVLAREWRDPDLRLVLLGTAGAAEADVLERIERLGLGGRVVRPGRVPAADRDGLIAAAAALVFPSEYEGFGAPLVEAMALGTPVICSDQPAVVEVAGEAAVVAPRRIEAWGAALDRVQRDRDALVEAGLRRAACFTTERSGEALVAAYRNALE